MGAGLVRAGAACFGATVLAGRLAGLIRAPTAEILAASFLICDQRLSSKQLFSPVCRSCVVPKGGGGGFDA
eukprot:scaffold113134_cov28-Tisochrysis_lutea.AAC.4